MENAPKTYKLFRHKIIRRHTRRKDKKKTFVMTWILWDARENFVKKIVELGSRIFHRRMENGVFPSFFRRSRQGKTCVAQCTVHTYCSVKESPNEQINEKPKQKNETFCYFSHSICWYYLRDRQRTVEDEREKKEMKKFRQKSNFQLNAKRRLHNAVTFARLPPHTIRNWGIAKLSHREYHFFFFKQIRTKENWKSVDRMLSPIQLLK